ncbi:unnamed protein product, partial [Medioppia subpectinata]
VIEISMKYESDECETGADSEIACGMSSLLTQTSNESHDNSSQNYILHVKSGHHKRLAGFQAEVAYGTENSLIIIDTIQKCAVLNVSTSNLYGAADPYQRSMRTMKKTPPTGVPPNRDTFDGNQSDADRCKSPTSDQCEESRSPDRSVPTSPLISTQAFDLPLSPIPPVPPPRHRKKKVNSETSSVKSVQTGDESAAEYGVCGESVEITADLTINYTKIESKPTVDQVFDQVFGQMQVIGPVIRPTHLNLQLKSKESKCNVLAKDSQSTPSVDSDNQSIQSTVGSDMSSPTEPNSDLSEKFNQIKANTRVANTQRPIGTHNLHKCKNKIKVIDLRPEDTDESLVSRIISKQQQQIGGNAAIKKQITPEMKRSRSQDKIDSSFSRSRSSSISSLENITIESVLYIAFAETYCTKSDQSTSPCLWVGTSLGSILVISLTLPDSTDNRILCLQTVIASPSDQSTSPCLWVGTSLGSILVISLTLPDSTDNRILCLQTVNASPSGSIYRLKGSILCISFLDFTGALLQLNADMWRDNPNRTGGNTTPSSTSSGADGNKRVGSLTITRTGSGGATGGSANRINKISPTSSSTDMRDPQFVVMVSEKQIRLVNLPTQQCAYKATLTETSFAVRADVVYMKSTDNICLAVYLGTGNIVVYSLPSLRLLIDIDFLALTDVRIARTICFSANGHGMYMSSPSTLTKFTILSSFRDLMADMVGTLFTAAKELPEPPKPSFLKGLFGGGTYSLDREELFGETNAGKPSKTTARHIPGTSAGIEQMKAQSGTMAAELARVREGLSERGEKVSQLEDKTARMQSEAEAFGSAAHNVMLKYRDKKWYQF